MRPAEVVRRVGPRRSGLLATVVLSLACGGGAEDTDGDRPAAGAAPPAAAPALEEERPPRISPRAGPPGTEVTVAMERLAVRQPLGIGFGTMVGHEILERVQADAEGVLSATVTVPGSAEPGPHFFLVTDEGDQPLAISNVFVVTAPDGSLTVRGTITGEGVECTAMRGGEGELYTLAGDVGGLAPGDPVVVEGTLAEMSTCQQGITIAVREVRPGA